MKLAVRPPWMQMVDVSDLSLKSAYKQDTHLAPEYYGRIKWMENGKAEEKY